MPRPTLKEIVKRDDTPAGRIFDLIVMAIVVVSLLGFSLETLPDLSETTRARLLWLELATVIWFSVEYGLRLWVATPRRSYALSFFGLVDLLAILPYFLALGIDARALRSLRLLRLVRILKLARYSAAARRFHRALRMAKEEIALYLAAILILLYLAAVGIHQCESELQPEAFGSIFHCLWWAVVTLTTVGYGDVYPITPGGRLFTFLMLLVGLSVISVPAGIVAAALSRARAMEDEIPGETERSNAKTAPVPGSENGPGNPIENPPQPDPSRRS